MQKWSEQWAKLEQKEYNSMKCFVVHIHVQCKVAATNHVELPLFLQKCVSFLFSLGQFWGFSLNPLKLGLIIYTTRLDFLAWNWDSLGAYQSVSNMISWVAWVRKHLNQAHRSQKMAEFSTSLLASRYCRMKFQHINSKVKQIVKFSPFIFILQTCCSYCYCVSTSLHFVGLNF